VTFAVTDTGIGIAPEHIGEIFQDFVQVNAPIQKRLRGTGLGLSLSRKLAIVLGGDVSVTSVLGEGSTFAVTIPTEFNAGRPPVATSAAAARSPRVPNGG
jgi:signal transduction histidine kinase